MSKVAQIIADKFITAMETTKALPWQKQFVSLMACNAVSKKPYRGINILLTSAFGADSEFITFNQAKAAGGVIKKGSKGIPICFYSKVTDKANPTAKPFMFMRYYNLFNLSDVEGGNIKRRELPNKSFSPDELAEKIAAAAGVPIKHGTNQPCYIPAKHEVNMPLPAQFKTTANYYKTLFHEVTHALSKDVGVKLECNFGSDSYGKEELIAELGANLFLTHCGIDAAGLFDNSQAYFEGWLGRIKGDAQLLISAASQAQKRYDILMARIYPPTVTDAVTVEAGEVEE